MAGWTMLLETVSDAWASTWWRASWQGSIAIFAIYAATRLLPRLPAPVQNLLWRLAYLKLLFSLVWFAPVELPLLPSASPFARPLTAMRQSLRGAAIRLAPGNGHLVAYDPLLYSESGPRVAVPAQQTQVPGFSSWLLLGWLIGLGVYARRVLKGIRAGARLREGCAPVSDPRVLELCQDLCVKLGIRRTPQLLASPREGTPLLIGLRRPAIVLPPQVIQRCDPAELRLVVAHELAHLRRGDLAWSWLLLILQGLLFFHPLVWLAGREWRETQEAACDHLALRTTRVTPAEYGAVLLRVAELCRPYPLRAMPALGITESFRTLQRRLLVMRYSQDSSRRWAAAGTLLLVLASTSLIPWQLGPRPAVAAAETEETSASTASENDDDPPLFDFEYAREGWFSRDPNASVTVVHREPFVKHGEGALQWHYDPNRPDALLTRFQPGLPREAKTLDFWLRADANGAFQLWFTEADGSVYHTHLRAPANRWQHFRIPLSDLALGEREDGNGHLDLDQVVDIVLQDLSMHHPGGVRMPMRKVWLDGFDLTDQQVASRRQPLPGEGGRKLLFDDFNQPVITWATNTEARVNLERTDGRSVLRARYQQGAQSTSAFRITNHWDPRYAKTQAIEVVARAAQPTQLAVTLREFDGTFTGPEYTAICPLPGGKKWGSYTLALSDFQSIDAKARRRPNVDPNRVWLMLVGDATDPGKRGEAELQIDRIAAVLPNTAIEPAAR